MTVNELIHVLSKMPHAAKVRYVWDGEARTAVTDVWLARSGCVLLGGDRETLYDENDMPLGKFTGKLV